MRFQYISREARGREVESMKQLREKFRIFMIGRYGMDQLGQSMAWAVLLLLLLNVMIRGRLPSLLLEAFAFIGLITVYLRMFSKNISRRYQENQIFLRYRFYVTEYWKKMRFRLTEGRKYRIFKCPGCKQRVRIPRGHGRVSIHCPKCGTDFIRKSG